MLAATKGSLPQLPSAMRCWRPRRVRCCSCHRWPWRLSPLQKQVGLFFRFMSSMPAILNEADSVTCAAATHVNASMTAFTSLVIKPVVMPTCWSTSVCAIVPTAFIDAFARPLGFLHRLHSSHRRHADRMVCSRRFVWRLGELHLSYLSLSQHGYGKAISLGYEHSAVV